MRRTLLPPKEIIAAAEIYGMECMLGRMLEAKDLRQCRRGTRLCQKIVTRIDLDGPVLCREDPIEGAHSLTKRTSPPPPHRGLASRVLDWKML